MKNKTVKYEEAVARNIKNMRSKLKKYKTTFEESGLSLVKHKLGIKKDDDVHNDKILSIVNKE